MGNNGIGTPKKMLVNMQIAHLGKITFRLQFLALAIMFASLMSFLSVFFYYFFLFAVTVMTIGSIYAWYPGFASLWGKGDFLVDFSAAFGRSWHYTVPIALALAVASIVCLCFDKRDKHWAEIFCSACVAVASIIFLIIKLSVH